MPSKLESYDKATRELMEQATDYDNIKSTTRFSLPEMVSMLRESYKYKLTYKKVFGEILDTNCDPATGFCIVSSYYIYERTGGDAVWQIMQTPLHWWLRHRQTGEDFDITYTQFSKPFPYRMGRQDFRIHNNLDPYFNEKLRQQALMLGKCAGIE